MSSLINPSNIDITYPIAGQDNDTQGFRDNFSSIKNNLLTAATEISLLQAHSTSAITFTSTLPGSPTSAGNIGSIAYDPSNNYMYVCSASNTWNKVPYINWRGAIQLGNLTTVEINSIMSPQAGMAVFNYSTGNVQIYTGTKWGNLTVS